jgi:hypothetical protein
VAGGTPGPASSRGLRARRAAGYHPRCPGQDPRLPGPGTYNELTMTPNTEPAGGRYAGSRPPGTASTFGANLGNLGEYGITCRTGFST